MDRYQRVEKPREEEPINENEIRITATGRMRNYISYATSLLEEKGSNEIVFKAMGRAINKTVMIVELIKRRIVGLHQVTSIGSIDITDTWEPLEGLLPLETTRHVSIVAITLSKVELDSSSIGYQCPLPSDQVKPWTSMDYDGELGTSGERGRGRGGRGRGRGRGNDNMVSEYADIGWENGGRGYGRGGRSRGGGRGRGFRGGMRGGYGGPYGGPPPYQQETGGYNDGSFAPPRGRGRGRGRGQGRGRGRNFQANGGYA